MKWKLFEISGTESAEKQGYYLLAAEDEKTGKIKVWNSPLLLQLDEYLSLQEAFGFPDKSAKEEKEHRDKVFKGLEE